MKDILLAALRGGGRTGSDVDAGSELQEHFIAKLPEIRDMDVELGTLVVGYVIKFVEWNSFGEFLPALTVPGNSEE